MSDTELIDWLEHTHMQEDSDYRVHWNAEHQRWKILDGEGTICFRDTLRDALSVCLREGLYRE